MPKPIFFEVEAKKIGLHLSATLLYISSVDNYLTITEELMLDLSGIA